MQAVFSVRCSWMLKLLFVSSLFCFGLGVAPINTFLSDTEWPIAQHDNYAQASTFEKGPLSIEGVDYLFGPDIAGPLTMLYTPDGSVLWGSSLKSVFKIDRSETKLRLIDSLEKPAELREKDTFRGIYNVLSKEGIFYISSANVIAAYTDTVQGDTMSGIKSIGSFDFSDQAMEKERILALNLNYDGHIVFLTTKGGVGVLSRDLAKLFEFKYTTAEAVSVTNSMAIDEFGGIYAVTSLYAHRLWWDESTETLNVAVAPVAAEGEHLNSAYEFGCAGGLPDKCQIWSTPYPRDTDPIEGRPTKEGSGTTPSLLKDANTDSLYMMIADGRKEQEVLAINGETGEIEASLKVDFNNQQDTDSYTEQSILVSDNKFLVTQNALTPAAVRVNKLLHLLNADRIVQNRGLPEFIEENVFLLPVVMGDNPRGYQQFELDTTGPSTVIRTTWIRNDVGCPNAIPTMSKTTGVMYCVGKKVKALDKYTGHGFNGTWTVEALDWASGETVFRAETGKSVLFNSLYAATQIGPNREIIYGSIGGIVRLRGSAEEAPLVENAIGKLTASAVSKLLGLEELPQLLPNPLKDGGEGTLKDPMSTVNRLIGSFNLPLREEAKA